ncbi:hypothetical protein, partial [Escherichia coli]|uniref:hypothetical protein n=1 Tax=Escherichia coli TaxID=562 RepID=UPI0019D50506
ASSKSFGAIIGVSSIRIIVLKRVSLPGFAGRPDTRAARMESAAGGQYNDRHPPAAPLEPP